jgi:hypothetical protein
MDSCDILMLGRGATIATRMTGNYELHSRMDGKFSALLVE